MASYYLLDLSGQLNAVLVALERNPSLPSVLPCPSIAFEFFLEKDFKMGKNRRY